MQNNFFGSKLNTVLLLILIILLGVTIWMIKGNRILAPLYVEDGQEQIIDTKDKTLKPIVSDKKPEQQSFTFLKEIVSEYPDSSIQECNFSNENYFYVNRDKVENGSHILGGAGEWYSGKGDFVASCPAYPYGEKHALCEKSMISCKMVYASKESMNKGFYPNGVDKYNLK
jgi:hypothetical protein